MFQNLVSISHNDLDGFGCQYLFKERCNFKNIYFGNTNYQSIVECLTEQLRKVAKQDIPHTLVVLSDLSILHSLAKKINNLFVLMGFDSNQIVIIDHHETSKDAAKAFPFLQLDTKFCATYLVQKFIDGLENCIDNSSKYKHFAERVNAYDLHLKEDKYYYEGLYLSDQLIEISRLVPEPLLHLRREWLFKLFTSTNLELEDNKTINDLDKNSLQRMEAIISHNLSPEFIADPNQSILQKIFRAGANEVIKQEAFGRVELDGIRLAVMKNYGSFYYAIVDPIMDSFDDIDACLHVNQKRNISLRSQAPIEIVHIAQKYFQGGGHPCAAGGKLPDRISFNKNLVEQLQALSI